MLRRVEEVAWMQPIGKNQQGRLLYEDINESNEIQNTKPTADTNEVNYNKEGDSEGKYDFWNSHQFDNPDEAEVEGDDADKDEVPRGWLGTSGGGHRYHQNLEEFDNDRYVGDGDANDLKRKPFGNVEDDVEGEAGKGQIKEVWNKMNSIHDGALISTELMWIIAIRTLMAVSLTCGHARDAEELVLLCSLRNVQEVRHKSLQ